MLEENLVNQIENVNNNFDNEPITEPKYFCNATDWKPAKMRPLEDFFYDIDTTKENIFETMKERGACREHLESIDEMNATEWDQY